MKTEEELLERIVVNPKVMGGKPVINGTRITVEQVLKMLAQGLTVKEILKDYPHLSKDDVTAVLLYAAKIAGEEEVYPVTATWADSVKFLVDECTGVWVSRKLKQMGHDSVSVVYCMKGASDEEIMLKAVEENRVVITNDKYFGRLAVFYRLPGMILLRLKDESIENKVKLVSLVVATHGEAISGNVVVVSEKKIRIQRIRKHWR
jgi:uncharacterized protein (DUF433 family)/predicted nuclease of predicted toxin-antitoxin system